MSNSFYGGRDGRPFIIKKTYATVVDMINDFAGVGPNEESIQPLASYEKGEIPAGKSPGITSGQVEFGDYVIIESENKNNPENGRIYRRSRDFNNVNKSPIKAWAKNKITNVFEETDYPHYGAVYTGQIRGASGNAPHLELLSTIKNVEDKYGEFKNSIEESIRSDETLIEQLKIEIQNELRKSGEITDAMTEEEIAEKVNANLDAKIEEILPNFIHDYSAHGPGYDIKIATEEGHANLTNKNLVPGKYTDSEGINKFNDEIKWKSCSVRDENEQETDAYIGFEIPYNVIEFDADTVSPYFRRNDEEKPRVNFQNLDLVDRHEDDMYEDEDGNSIEPHPFYRKWRINIPKGIHGMSIENIQVGVAKEDIYAFDFTDIAAEDSRDADTGLLKVKAYDGRQDDINNRREIIYCTFVDYDRIPAGDEYKIYLGDYNMIDEISINTEIGENGEDKSKSGTITIDYSHDDTVTYESLLTWITGVQLDKGYLDIDTNNGNAGTEIHKQLHWIENITIDDNGTVNFIDVAKTEPQSYSRDQLLTWIEGITLDTDSGKIDIETNNGKHEIHKDLTWVKSVKISDTGFLDIETTTNKKEDETHEQLQWVKEIKIANDGTVTFVDINGTERMGPLGDSGSEAYKNLIQWITNVSLDAETGAFKLNFNNGAESLERTLQWVKDISISDNGTVTTEYTTKTETEELKLNWIKSATVDDNKNLNIQFNNDNISEINVSLLTMGAGETPADNLAVGGLWFETKEME